MKQLALAPRPYPRRVHRRRAATKSRQMQFNTGAGRRRIFFDSGADCSSHANRHGLGMKCLLFQERISLRVQILGMHYNMKRDAAVNINP